MSTGQPRTFNPLVIAIVMIALLAAACGSDSSSRRRGSSAVVSSGNLNPEEGEELTRLDEKLRDLEAKTEDLRARLDTSQETISSSMAVDQLASLQAGMQNGRTFMELDRNDIFRVNGIVMDMNEFKRFASRKGKGICQPTPVLVVAPESDYDLVANVMDVVYQQNCSNLDIVEETPEGMN